MSFRLFSDDVFTRTLFGYILQLVAQLLAYPLGRLWARAVPNVKIFGVQLNPGPFTVKEHVLITIMASVGCKSAYAVSFFIITWIYAQKLIFIEF